MKTIGKKNNNMPYGVIPIEERSKYTPEEAREEQLKLISEINLMKAYIRNHMEAIREIHYPTIACNYVPQPEDNVYYGHKYILEPENEDLIWQVVDTNYKVKSCSIKQTTSEGVEKYVEGIPWILLTNIGYDPASRSETNQ